MQNVKGKLEYRNVVSGVLRRAQQIIRKLALANYREICFQRRKMKISSVTVIARFFRSDLLCRLNLSHAARRPGGGVS
jgi:hypothetical protein